MQLARQELIRNFEKPACVVMEGAKISELPRKSSLHNLRLESRTRIFPLSTLFCTPEFLHLHRSNACTRDRFKEDSNPLSPRVTLCVCANVNPAIKGWKWISSAKFPPETGELVKRKAPCIPPIDVHKESACVILRTMEQGCIVLTCYTTGFFTSLGHK